MANRPPNPRLESINPVFDIKNTSIPVTPAVDDTGRTSFFQHQQISSPEVETPEGIENVISVYLEFN
jgi:trehalose 6-phosphate synthase/phosphatase